MQQELILASASPRRREILTTLGIPYRVVVSAADEGLPDGIAPAAAVETLAARKAEAVAAALPPDGRDTPILAADTVVAVDDTILGKPADEADAAAMLRAIAGRAHTVYTGVALLRGGRMTVAHAATRVHVASLREDEIAAYIATGESSDKAGAYAIQGRFARHITGIEGDYFNVVGLPGHLVWSMLTAE